MLAGITASQRAGTKTAKSCNFLNCLPGTSSTALTVLVKKVWSMHTYKTVGMVSKCFEQRNVSGLLLFEALLEHYRDAAEREK